MALPDVVVGSTGHVTHHNVLHNYTQFERGVRFVETAANGGSDSNDGLTPFEPKATVDAAVQSLPSGTGFQAGGTVHVGAGDFTLPTAGVTVGVRGVSIQGVGRATRLVIPAAAPYGLRWNFSGGDFNFSHVGGFKLQAADSTVNQVGILIEDVESVYLDRIWFQGIGYTWAGTPTSADADPACVKIRGVTTNTWADWQQWTRLHGFQNFRGIAAPGGGSNGFVSHSVFTSNVREAVYVRRQQNGSSTTLGAEWFFEQCYFAGTGDGQYMMRFESDPANGNHVAACAVSNTRTEPGAGSGGHHIYLDCANVMIDQHHFDGGGKSAVTPIAVNFASSRATGNIVGHYLAIDSGNGVPIFSNNSGGSTNKVWTGVDYSG